MYMKVLILQNNLNLNFQNCVNFLICLSIYSNNIIIIIQKHGVFYTQALRFPEDPAPAPAPAAPTSASSQVSE